MPLHVSPIYATDDFDIQLTFPRGFPGWKPSPLTIRALSNTARASLKLNKFRFTLRVGEKLRKRNKSVKKPQNGSKIVVVLRSIHRVEKKKTFRMPKATDLFKNKKDNGWGGDTLKSSLGRPFPVNSLATEGQNWIAASKILETELSHRGWYQANFNLRIYLRHTNLDKARTFPKNDPKR